MCGIIGYTGDKRASDIIIQGLKYLEYRGYDSSGVAVLSDGAIKVAKKEGRIKNLEEHLEKYPIEGHLAIGHTRWATHGKPSDDNAHPFISFHTRFAVVHNGIIENYLEIKEELMAEGVVFRSQTDSEVVAHLVEFLDKGDTKRAILDAVAKLKGAFALGIISVDSPDVLYAVKKDNPLIVGVTDNEGFICSDINSLQKFLSEVIVLDNDQMAVVRKGSVELFSFDGTPLDKKFVRLTAEEENALSDYECFMDKEMSEIPAALRRAIKFYREEKCFSKIDKEYLKKIRRINIVGCGTALHAGLYGEKLLNKFIPDVDVHSEMASEFRYDDVKVDENTLTVTISQSGETADTLTCQRMVNARGGKTLTICNVPTSSMVHYADYALMICAGPEVAVASTKAFNCQELVFAMFVFDLALLRGAITAETYAHFCAEIDALPEKAEKALALREKISAYAARNFRRKSVFYLGRGMDYCVAMEGSLKLKEISYIHCEAYAAGELKHGTLALIEKDIMVVALVTQKNLIDKMYSSLAEVKTRGASLTVITPFADNPSLLDIADYIMEIPVTEEVLSPIISVIPTQLMSYYIARAKGCDIDKPRNLAKSVTVE